jgi:alpha-tubulin suppressor-like RCC1 family protein
VQVAAGGRHTVGLKKDGRVVAVGYNYSGQCNVSSLSNIMQVAAGVEHTVGLRRDGSVVAVGGNSQGQCNVSSWTDIVQVAAGEYHTIGLKEGGTVVAVGLNDSGQCDVSNWNWTGIKHVAAGQNHTVGVKTDGSVLAAGANFIGQCEVSAWSNMVQVAAGSYHTIGLKADGNVAAAGGFNKYYLFVWNLNTSHNTTTTTIPSWSCAVDFIYGENSEETELLREYRDKVLSKTAEGQELIKTYYKFSPSITKLLEQRPLLKNKAKAFIDSMLPGIRKKVNESNKDQ